MKPIPWKVKAIDETIGPIEPGVITLFYGETGVGKTTLTTYWPITRIVEERQKKLDKNDAIFIVDTDGGFDMPRFEQILSAHGIDIADIIDNIHYFNVTEFDEQHTVITKKIPKLIDEKKLKPLLISVDPLTAIYRGIVLRTDPRYKASVIGTYTGKLDLQLVTLRRLAVEYKCPIFVSTWPSSRIGDAMGNKPGEVPFIGGRQMGYIPKVIAEIKLDEKNGIPDRYSPVRRMILFKARGLPPGLKTMFKLTSAGISDI